MIPWTLEPLITSTGCSDNRWQPLRRSEQIELPMSDSQGSDGPELAQSFIWQLVSDTRLVGSGHGVAASDVNWNAFWGTSQSESLDESSVGQGIVRAAQAASGSIALPLHRRTWVTIFTWVQNIGFVVLLFVGWQLWGTAIAQHHAQSQLQSQFQAVIRRTGATHDPTKPVTLIPAAAAVLQPSEGSAIARLQIPALGVDQIVVAGTSTGDLSKGPGHYTGTAVPGQEGNVAIAGHRTTDGAPFNRLGQLVPGDRIILTTTSNALLTYRVSAPPVAVSPSDVGVLNNFGDNRVTLTTCTPEFSASQRMIVVGEFQKGAAVPQSASTTERTTYHITDSGTASWDFGYIPIVLLELAFLVALGLLFRRLGRWLGRFGQVALLLPLWAVGLYVLFQSLTSLLPPSV